MKWVLVALIFQSFPSTGGTDIKINHIEFADFKSCNDTGEFLTASFKEAKKGGLYWSCKHKGEAE